MKLKTYQLWILPVISSFLLSCGWMNGIFQLLLVVGFIPLLVVEEYYFQQSGKYRSFRIFPKALLAFILWNGISTWWIWNASEAGALMAIVFNSLFMATVFWLFHATKRVLGRKIGNIAFIIYWLGFEYLHINWELSWSWLTLGNGLSENISIIQWYEYTGVLGGSLWILLINVLFAESIIKYITNSKNKLIKNKENQ
jgi:apolipoprotein N-acyltransferase